MVVLYFLPMFVVIAVLASSFARRNKSEPKPSGVLIVAGFLLAVVLAGLAFWLAGAVR
jgi:hypothetical protein